MCVKVSIIIPVYNASATLARCLDSIITQTLKELEIIIVDDGSHDESLTICQKYQKLDSRIQVFSCDNVGVSSARNYGLGKAIGEYIGFVDSDDSVKQEMFELLYQIATVSNADIAVSSYYSVYGHLVRAHKSWDGNGIFTNKEYALQILQEPYSYYYGVVWNKLYKRDFIEKRRIRFDTKVTYGEDFIFNLELLKGYGRVVTTKQRFYYYYRGSKSLSKAHGSREEYRKKRIHLYECYEQLFVELGLYKEYKDRIQEYLLRYVAEEGFWILCDQSIPFPQKRKVKIKTLQDTSIRETFNHRKDRKRSSYIIRKYKLKIYRKLPIELLKALYKKMNSN